MSVQNITNWGLFLSASTRRIVVFVAHGDKPDTGTTFLNLFLLLVKIVLNLRKDLFEKGFITSVGLIRGRERLPEDFLSSSCDNFPWTIQIIQVLDTCQYLNLSQTKQPFKRCLWSCLQSLPPENWWTFWWKETDHDQLCWTGIERFEGWILQRAHINPSFLGRFWPGHFSVPQRGLLWKTFFLYINIVYNWVSEKHSLYAEGAITFCFPSPDLNVLSLLGSIFSFYF